MLDVQDRYVGDIGDFGKYALLKALAGDDLRLGMHWYRNADEEANRDGKFTGYMRLRGCDPPLYDSLNDIVCRGRRAISEVESASILPRRTIFYSLPLSSREASEGTRRSTQRAEWSTRALEVLSPAEIVFMDPDNGLPGPSVHSGATKGPKYLFPDELKPYRQRGQSLVVYHHQTREKGGLATTVPQKFQILHSLGFEQAWALVFRRVSVGVYFILPAPSHVAILEERSTNFIETEWGWGGHFQLVKPHRREISASSLSNPSTKK